MHKPEKLSWILIKKVNKDVAFFYGINLISFNVKKTVSRHLTPGVTFVKMASTLVNQEKNMLHQKSSKQFGVKSFQKSAM